MSAFGEELRSVIEIFQLKYINVANIMQYDASYISKWINSDVLPSSRSIKQICNALSVYIQENCSEDQIAFFCREKGFEDSQTKDQLRDSITGLLFDAFKKDTSDRKIAESEKNIIFEDRLQTIVLNLRSLSERSDELNMVILGDVASLKEEDLLFLMDVLAEADRLPFNKGRIDILISGSSIELADSTKAIVTLMNMLMLNHNVSTFVNTCPTQQLGLIIIIDNLIYSAQCRLDYGWLTENFIKENDVINSKLQIVRHDILPISRRIYTENDILPVSASGGKSNSYWIYRESQLLGKLDTSFCVPEITECLHGIDEDIKNSCSKQFKSLLRLLENGKEHKCIIYRDAMEDFIYNGTISVAGEDYGLSIIDRLKYLQGMTSLLDQYQNLQIRLIDGYVVDEIKHRNMPSIYVSQNSCGFLMFPKSGISTYCHIQHPRFIDMMERMFTNLWNQNGVIHYDIRGYLRTYIQFCEDMVLLDEL